MGKHEAGRAPAEERLTSITSPASAVIRRWPRIAGRALGAALALVVLAGSGIAWTIKSRADDTLDSRTITVVQTDDPNIVSSSEVPALWNDAPIDHVAENILLLGSDSHRRRSVETRPPVGQSDTLMIAHLGGDRRRITVLSLPRDLQVAAPGCKRWVDGVPSDVDQPTSPGELWKITNAYAVGGPGCTVRAVQQVTGLRIDRVVVVDLKGFSDVVDAIGGLDLTFCRPIVDRELGTLVTEPGTSHLDGQAALNVVRARKVAGDPTGDLGRIRRQQVVLAALVDQLTGAGTLLNPARLDTVLQALLRHTYTDNMSLDELVELAESVGDLPPGAVSFYTAPTVMSPTDPEALILAPRAAELFQALIDDQPLPRPDAPRTGVAPTVPETVQESPTGRASGEADRPTMSQNAPVIGGDRNCA